MRTTKYSKFVILKSISLTLFLFLISNKTANADTITSDVTSFSRIPENFKGLKVFTFSINEEKRDTIEDDFYRGKLVNYLKMIGFENSSSDEADYLLEYDYSVSKPIPITQYKNQPINRKIEENVLIGPPGGQRYIKNTRWVTIGYEKVPYTYIYYDRYIKIYFVKNKKEKIEKSDILFEGTAISRGYCGNMRNVFEYVAYSIFDSFPNSNGRKSFKTNDGYKC